MAPRLQNRKQLLQLGGTEIAESQSVAATRCDRSVQIGCTYENLDQLSELGVTEMDVSVRPKCTKRIWKFKSMTNRGLRVLLTQSGSNMT